MDNQSHLKKEISVLKYYYKSICQFKLLSWPEEVSLAKRIQNNDEQAKIKLIESNLRLVVKIARRYTNSNLSYLDLIQEGNLGLIRAAEKFDHHKNVRFSTYASLWIKQAITRAISEKNQSIRLPYRKGVLVGKIKEAESKLLNTLEREPTPIEIAKEVDISVLLVKKILGLPNCCLSLDKEFTEDSVTLKESLADFSYSPEKVLEKKWLREKLSKEVDGLREKEREVLLYRYNFKSPKKITLKEIGERLGVTPETVRQMEKRALLKLKPKMDSFKDLIN